MLQRLEGHFVGWQNTRSGQPKSIQIQTATILQSVSLGKNLRHLLGELLQPGMRMSLQAKVKKHHLRAKFVVLLPVGETGASHHSLSQSATGQPTTVQVCKSKHCCKNGSKQLCSSLKQIAPEANIQVREVGCLGKCQNAPVVKIGDRKYDNLSPKKVVDLALKCCGTRPSSPSSGDRHHLRSPQ